jgi:hypothetical protein
VLLLHEYLCCIFCNKIILSAMLLMTQIMLGLICHRIKVKMSCYAKQAQRGTGGIAPTHS